MIVERSCEGDSAGVTGRRRIVIQLGTVALALVAGFTPIPSTAV